MSDQAESSLNNAKSNGGAANSPLFRSSLSRQGFIIIAVPLLLSFVFILGLKFLA